MFVLFRFRDFRVLQTTWTFLGSYWSRHWNSRAKRIPWTEISQLSCSLESCLMSTQSHISCRTRGKSPKFDPAVEIGRRKIILENLQPKLWRYHHDSKTEVTNLSKIFSHKKIIMNYSGVSISSSTTSSSQSPTSSLIGIMYNHFNPIQSMTNIAKIIKQYGLL